MLIAQHRERILHQLTALSNKDFAELLNVFDSDCPLCQAGNYEQCGHPIVSWAKSAFCPVCGNAVCCT